jgi:hypothetical protein
MNHIQQKVADGDCGVAAIAILTGKTYDNVMYYVPPCVYEFGLWIVYIPYALMAITGEAWGIKYYAAPLVKQLSMFDFPKEPTMYGIYRPDGVFHYIVSDGEYLYDPLLPNRITLEQARLDYHSGWTIYAEIKK